MIVILILLLVFFLSISAFFSAAETALFSLSTIKVKSYQAHGDPRKRMIADLLAKPRDLIVTIIILNILGNILMQNTVATLFGKGAGWLLNVGVPLVLSLVLGEVVPKSVGLANHVKVAHAVAPILIRAKNFFYPLIQLFIKITNVISRCMFFFLKKEEEISIDELQHALRTSRDFGVLNQDEAELVCGYLNLQESTIKAIMRPREEVLFYDVEEPLSRLVHLFVDQECSRIPICEGSLDKVLGMISSRTFFLHKPDLHESGDLKPILQKPFFVPETMTGYALLRQMYAKKESFAVVVDEYGSVSGIIALEDLIEAVVGEIIDRRHEKNRFTRAGEDVIITSGKLELAEFEEIFNTPLKSENNMVTIGGWLTEQLGDIPKAGTKHLTEDFLFHVLAADPQRVRRIYVRDLRPKKKN